MTGRARPLRDLFDAFKRKAIRRRKDTGDMDVVEAEVIAPQKAINEPHSARRIKRMTELNGAKSYLEIGVFKGKTFNNLSFPTKVGVDPFFNFDVSEYQAAGTQFVAKKSDDFFIEKDPALRFDLIFLDGLHSFKQTLRDFCNSLACCNPSTLWLIDDVFPSDVYSAIPDAAEARQARRKAGGVSNAWHGDVYKLLFFIHDFMPTLSFVTINTQGNLQAIVWQRSEARQPVFDSCEAIDRLDYFSLLKMQHICNMQSEPDAFATLQASLQAPVQDVTSGP